MNTSHPLKLIELTIGASADVLEPAATVIVLHGLGADGSDFIPVAQAMDLSSIGPVRFVLPSAPERPVTINGGYVMRAWYDIFPPSQDPSVPRQEDQAGLLQSQAQVEQLIAREQQRGMPSQRIVLMGFSQGCAMTLLTGLRFGQRLGGLIALSGYLPLADQTEAAAHPANRDVPVLMIHGDHDDVVTPDRAVAARERLTGLGYSLQWASYPMGHEMCMEEVRDIQSWLIRHLAAT